MSATYTNTITQRRKTSASSRSKQRQQQWSGSDASVGEPNERLHFRSRSTNSAITAAPTAAFNSPPPLCCNGGLSLLNCCLDVNCHLNAPLRGSVSRHTTPAATPTPTPKQASPSPTSDRSFSCSPSRSCSLSRSRSPSRHQRQKQKLKLKNSAAAAAAAAVAQDSKTTELTPPFTVSLKIDLFSWILFLLAFGTRFYKLATPRNIV